MNLLNKYLSDCSPYILAFEYNLEKRELTITFADKTDNEIWLPGKRLIFTDIRSFSENPSEDLLDDDCIDSILGLHVVPDGKYCLMTEKRELILDVGKEPSSQLVE